MLTLWVKIHLEIKAGSCENSDCSILSFHPVKHITTGEGGAVTTNSKEIYEKLLELRAHGIKRLPRLICSLVL